MDQVCLTQISDKISFWFTISHYNDISKIKGFKVSKMLLPYLYLSALIVNHFN